jgi:hypothetical protein
MRPPQALTAERVPLDAPVGCVGQPDECERFVDTGCIDAEALDDFPNFDDSITEDPNVNESVARSFSRSL